MRRTEAFTKEDEHLTEEHLLSKRLTTQDIAEIYQRKDYQFMKETARDDFLKLLMEVDLLTLDVQDARNKLETVYKIVYKIVHTLEINGEHTIATELVKALLAPTREVLKREVVADVNF